MTDLPEQTKAMREKVAQAVFDASSYRFMRVSECYPIADAILALFPTPRPIDDEKVEALREAATDAGQYLASGDWHADGHGACQIWGESLKGGVTHIADVRGWGYLTGGGHGALGLPEGAALEAQRNIQRHIALANPSTIKWLLDDRAALLERVPDQELFGWAYRPRASAPHGSWAFQRHDPGPDEHWEKVPLYAARQSLSQSEQKGEG